MNPPIHFPAAIILFNYAGAKVHIFSETAKHLGLIHETTQASVPWIESKSYRQRTVIERLQQEIGRSRQLSCDVVEVGKQITVFP